MPQKFTNVTPIQQQGQTFSNVAPIDASPEQPDAISRFGSSLASGVGIVSPEQGKNFFAHPLDTLEGVGQGMIDLGRRAYGEFKQGDVVRGGTHAVEAAIPGLGPTLAHAGDQLESGDTAGGIGTTLGAGLTVATGSPEARGVLADTGSRVVRGAAKGANAALEHAPGGIGAGIGAAVGHATGIPEAGTLGGLMGYGIGKEVLPKLRVPGENFGLPRGTMAQQMQKATPAEAEAAPASLPEGFESRAPYQSPTGTAENPATGGPSRGSISQQMQQPIQRPSLKEMMSNFQSEAEKGLGGKELQPDVPLKQQVPSRGSVKQMMDTPTPQKAAPGLAEQMKGAAGSPIPPKGELGAPITSLDQAGNPIPLNPVKSSALAHAGYDPAAREFHAQYKSGDGVQHVFGDVSPDEAQAFEQSASKGAAMQQIKQGHPLVAKIVDGKRVAMKATAKP